MSKLKKHRIERITSGFVGLMTSVMMMGGLAVLPAAAVTAADLQAQIDAFISKINNKPRRCLGYKSALQLAVEKGII